MPHEIGNMARKSSPPVSWARPSVEQIGDVGTAARGGSTPRGSVLASSREMSMVTEGDVCVAAELSADIDEVVFRCEHSVEHVVGVGVARSLSFQVWPWSSVLIALRSERVSSCDLARPSHILSR